MLGFRGRRPRNRHASGRVTLTVSPVAPGRTVHMAHDWIAVRGARVHNLKNIDVDLPARPAGRHHRPVRIGQVLARLRHDLRRRAAALRRVAVVLRPPVPRADGEAGRRSDRRPVAGDRDRAEDDRLESAIHRRHRHRDLRLPAAALRQHRRAALPPVRPRDRVAVARAHHRHGDALSATTSASTCSRRSSAAARASSRRSSPALRARGFTQGARRRPVRARSTRTSSSIAAATTRSTSSSIG